MKDIDKEEFEKKIHELSKKIIHLIEKENTSSPIILWTLTTLVQSFSETINLSKEKFRDLMQSVVNDYRER